MVSPSSATPDGSRRPVAVLGTLLPHMHPGRHHVYRDVVALALLAALIAAGVGSLPVALVLTAVALPAAVLVYIHDHRLWHDEPITVIVVTFGLSLLLGVGVGLLETHFIPYVVTGARGYHLPPVEWILELGVLVPVVAFVAVLIAPLIVSARSAFAHPFDVVVAASLSGAALSLGLSLVVQHGAFTHVQATAGDPAHVAFLALTLGFLQPIVLATAATVAVLGLRRLGVSPVVGVIEGLALVIAYELATTLLQPYGTRGIVLTAVTAFVLAGAGLVATRNGMHAAITADPGTNADATAHPGHVEHRLHGGVVTAVMAVVVVIAAAIAVAVVVSGPATHPKPPKLGPGGIKSHAAGAGFVNPGMGQPSQSGLGNLTLASKTTSLAAGSGSAITLYNSVSITPAAGWTVAQQDQGVVNIVSSDKTVVVTAGAGAADEPNINQEASDGMSALAKDGGLNNVQQDTSPQVQTIQGKNFTQALPIDYTGNVQTSQGTTQVEGMLFVLFNSSTHTTGAMNVLSPSDDAMKAAMTDIENMLASMM